MPGGVAGDRPVILAAPMPIIWLAWQTQKQCLDSAAVEFVSSIVRKLFLVLVEK